ncbi:hypothetical protein L5L91_17340 [Shewanella sp. SM55]|uniref:tetratricopeptide repeat protein n=1 Tax=Shewanella sp. SM55 TaxID=2912800 RepID=UPI0021D7EB03|nr:hypothetical protein [Shewanella sp. SM55]MCU8062502.1 hypothetical protein [Shewanella sp. SM55]
MTQPVPKSNGYFDDLSFRIQNNLRFDDLEFRRFLQEVNKLEQHHVKFELAGLAYFLQGDKEQALANYKNALASSMASVETKRNYYFLLRKLGLLNQATDFARDLNKVCNIPEFLKSLYLLYVIALDLDGAEDVYDQLHRMNKFEPVEVIIEASKEVDLMKNFCSNVIKKEQLALIGQAALQTAEEHGCILLGNRITHLEESSHLSVSYVIDCESYTSDQVFDINVSLIDTLIDMELDCIPAVVQFVRLDKNRVALDGSDVIVKTEEVVNGSQS